MILTSKTTGSRRTLRSIVVSGASLAVVASVMAGPAAVAASSSGTARHAPANAPHRHGTPSKHVVRHHPAPPQVRNKAKAARNFGLTRPKSVKLKATNPVHLRKPRAVKAHIRRAPVTRSYSITSNVRHAPGIIGNITGSCQITAGNHAGTWSPASCPNGYEVQGDVKVPVGKTLTVKPNTIVYFDTTVAGSLGSLDPSELTDLIVDGTLTVSGTASQPVTFTSANAAPSSSSTPAAGDWGYVFFDHTATNHGTGSITRLRLKYGEGIAADRTAPPITSSTIANVAAGESAPSIASSITPGAGIDYEDVPGGTVSFTNNTFDGSNVAGIKFASDYNHTAFNGSSNPGHSFTLVLIGNHITGGGTSDDEDAVNAHSETAGATAAANNSGVAFNIHSNRITEAGDGYALDVQAENQPGSVTGTAAIVGAFHDNRVATGSSASGGVYFYSYSLDTAAAGTKTCNGAAACVIVPFVRDNISSDGNAVDTEAYVNAGPGGALIDTPVGYVQTKKIKRHHRTITKHIDVSGGSITDASTSDDAWYAYSYNAGLGAATLSMPIVKTPFNSYYTNVDAESYAERGAGTLYVPVRDSTMISSAVYNLELEGEGSTSHPPASGQSGAGKVTANITNSTLHAYDENIYVDDALSGYRSASTQAAISGSTLTSATDYNIYTVTYGSNSGGSGGASLSAPISSSKLDAYEGNVYDDTYAFHGKAPATATVTANKSTLNAYDESNIESEVYASQDAGSYGLASSNTSAVNSKMQSESYNFYLDTYSYYGAAMSSPKIINSTALAYAYAIYNYVEAASSGHTGTAIANPVIKGSTVDAYEYDIYNEAYGNYGTSNVTASPAISHSSVTSGSEYVIYNYAESPYEGTSPGGTCTANPSISYGTAAASAYLIYNECYGYYAASTGNPVLRNVNAVAGDDYGIYNDIESSVNGGHGSAIGNPLITGSDIAAYDYVIENDVYGFRGGAVGNPLITNSTVSSSDDYAIYNDIYSDYGSVTSGHTATANPRILSSNVTAYDEPLYNESYGYYGPAFANPVVRSSTLMSTDDDVIENYAYGSNHGGTGSGTANPVVSKSAMRAYDDGLYNESYAGNGSATANPVITSTPIRSLFDTAVYNYAEGDPGGATANPTITGSPILCGDCGSEYGVENEATSAKSFAIADPVLSFSPIRIASGYGLDNEAYSATSAGHGGAKANPTVINSGIVAYEQALYNEAKAEHGNSNADGSFTVTNSYLRSNYYQPAEDYVYGSGTGKTTAKMNLTGDTLRAADDDGIEVYIKPQGTGTSSLGGLVKNSSITSEGDGVYVDFAPTGSSSFTFNTAFLNTPITSTDDDGINVGTESIGRSVLLEPTITNSSITAVDDYAVDLEANGYAGSSTGALTVAPVISGLTSTSDDGIYLLAADDLGSASPGSTVVAGSITNSNITSTDDVGIGAYSECEYCGAGSVERLRVTNSSIKAYDEALSIESTVSSHSTGPAIVGGYATSTKHNSMTSFDDYGVYVDNSASSGKVTDAFHESGFTISGESGPIYNYAYATANSASVSSSFTNNTLPNGNGDSGDDGIYQYVVAGGVGHNATVSGSFSHNVISDAPGNAYGIDLYSSAGGTANTDLTIAHNTITNMGGYGIYVDASGNATPSSTHHVSIVNNTINRVGKGGIWTDGVRPTITANRVYNVGLADGASPGDIDGIFVDDSGHQGSVTCNVVFGNTQGIEYGSGNPTSGAGGHNGDPKTNNNSFKDPSSSLRNVKDLRTANAGAGQTDAQNNYWGGSPRLHSPTNRYDVTPRLTAAPNCTKTAGA